ncbi:hypothetical protein RhiirA5_501989 [Rhizophagus irregularis]|uniref:Uncharacterized protein n=1 Tax=Rhizophagus irregularis TaxID=588596 RepID=A0A2N0PFL1_9GLOM|nr:hypothetical protein RhiirA5_501989 [Rhizophagus irregularis]
MYLYIPSLYSLFLTKNFFFKHINMVDIYKINSVINKIKGAEQQNTLNKEALDKKVREQEHICNELWWEKGDQNIKKLTENTQEIMGLVRNQNDITRCAFSLNRDTLKLLEDISDNTREDIKYLRRIIKDLTVTKEFFRYRDWVTKLIQDIVRKSDKKLEDINDKVNKSLGEFVLLMKFKWTSNDEFHVWRYQTEEEALKELKRLSFPEDLECFMNPLEKAIRPLKFNYLFNQFAEERVKHEDENAELWTRIEELEGMTMKKIISKPSSIRDVTRSDEKGAIEANREETLRCCFYAREFKRMYKDFMASNKVGEKKAKGQVYDFIFKQIPNTKRKTLCRQTQKALRIDDLFEKIGMDKISKFSNFQIQTIIDHFTENPNMEFIDDSEDEEQEDDQNNVLEVQVNLLNSAKASASNA